VGTNKRSRQKANRAQGRAEMERMAARRKVRKRTLKFGLGIPLLIVLLVGFVRLVSGDSNDSPVNTTDSIVDDTTTDVTIPTNPGVAITGDTPCPSTDGTQERASSFEKAPPICIDVAKSYSATITTSQGVIEVDLDTSNTPSTVNNFVVLSRYKYYDGSLLFRTDPSIDIIQGGGQSNTDSPGYTIEDEGDLVMARTGAPNSAGAQFFFATGPKVSLLNDQGTYVKFGKVTSGIDVLKKIMDLHSGPEFGSGAPDPAVTVTSIVITEK